MLRLRSLTLLLLLATLILSTALPNSAQAALIDQVNQAFRQIHNRAPALSEWTYWAGRVQRQEKTTYDALVGAIAFQNAQTGSSPATFRQPVNNISAAAGFAIDKKFYPSPHNPNFLPEGTLVTSPSTPNIYYIRDGKKSWVLPNVLDKWFKENHFFKSNIVINISDADLARYPTASSVNKLYIGKVLKHPNGGQFYIDDKLRKRPLSAGVRSALKFPGGNLYPTSTIHLNEFKTGPALTADKFPGGMSIYDGPFHGGRIWKTEEIAGGTIVKRLYLKDRFYEADGYPDESQRAPADSLILAKHTRGQNIDRYPDGWVIAISSNIYVMQNGQRRLITAPNILAALGYTDSIHTRREYPDLFAKLAQGQPISAFKGIVADGVSASKGAPAPAPSTASNLIKVRPAIRALIAQVNDNFRFIFDKDPSISENKTWVDALYGGEFSSATELLAAMKSAKINGRRIPARTSRTATLSGDSLKLKWFSYLFYFVHQKEPAEADRDYWYSRIDTDKKSITDLGGTIQWLKDTTGQTRR